MHWRCVGQNSWMIMGQKNFQCAYTTKPRGPYSAIVREHHWKAWRFKAEASCLHEWRRPRYNRIHLTIFGIKDILVDSFVCCEFLSQMQYKACGGGISTNPQKRSSTTPRIAKFSSIFCLCFCTKITVIHSMFQNKSFYVLWFPLNKTSCCGSESLMKGNNISWFLTTSCPCFVISALPAILRALVLLF